MGLKGAKAMSAFAAKEKSLKNFGKSWTRNISLPVAALGIYAGKTASDFDSAMSLIETQAGGSAKEVGILSKEVLAMHDQFTPLERAQGLFYIESAGLRGAKAMKMLQANVELATTGNSNLEHTVFGTVGAMNALGKEGKNFTKVASVMNAMVGHGHMRMEELVGAISTGLVGAAKSFGVSWAGMNSAVAFFTRMGEPAQQVATRLRQTITHLATNASTKGAEALESIGLSTEKMGAQIRKTGRIGPVIKELAEHLNAVGKSRADQVLTDAFGGGRFGTQIREATQRWQLLLRTEREVGKFGTAKQLKAGFLHREQQPAVKLKETWADLSAVLVNLGNVALPAAVPALQKLTGVISGVGHAFGSMSPEMQAGIGGFLLLTGPIAHGLGYFAGGVGKALVLTKKLAQAGSAFGSVLSPNVMTERRGLKGALGAAGEKLGVGAALQTAKGFAYSLGPAVAAYGIGNIVTSATSGDWGDAGLEAGGAYIGGLVGYLGGGGIGAMLGIGLGSLAGELAKGLFSSSSSSKALTAQERFTRQAEKTKVALEREKRAGKALASAGGAVVQAHKRQGAAAQEVRHAEKGLQAIREDAGPNSAAAIRAEIHLAKAGERRLKATHQLHRAERAHGESLSIFKEQNAYAILQTRQRLKELKGKVAEAQQRRKALKAEGVTGGRLAKADETLTKRRQALWGTKSSLFKLWEEADKRAGSSWANFVKHANAKSLELGRGFKSVHREVEGLQEALERLHNAPGPGIGPFKKGAVEQGLEKAIGRARKEEAELHPQHQSGGRPHSSANSRPRVSGGFRGPEPKRLTLRTDGLAGVMKIEVHSHNTLELDGRTVAESTTRHSQKAANRE